MNNAAIKAPIYLIVTANEYTVSDWPSPGCICTVEVVVWIIQLKIKICFKMADL